MCAAEWKRIRLNRRIRLQERRGIRCLRLSSLRPVVRLDPSFRIDLTRHSNARCVRPFLLVFAAAKFAFHFEMWSLFEVRGEFAEVSEYDATVPFGPGFPFAQSVLAGSFRRD